HAMMDLLVELCLQNHLNPSNHALEIRSSETQQPLNFKPNTLVGTLNVHTVFLKEKVPEAKVKPVPPKVPEKTVRLVVNYLRTQKAVVRVSPDVPLQSLLPVICAKCEVSPEHVVLLRDSVAGEELELSKSLSELGIQELYAWDNKRGEASLGLRCGTTDALPGCLTTPNSPCVNPRSVILGPSLSLGNISGVSVKSDLKKRRAPPPPTLPRTGPPVQDKTSEKWLCGSVMTFHFLSFLARLSVCLCISLSAHQSPLSVPPGYICCENFMSCKKGPKDESPRCPVCYWGRLQENYQ
ncbi:hypothetical protein FD755_012225, partial [Muntiacus reevesi]